MDEAVVWPEAVSSSAIAVPSLIFSNRWSLEDQIPKSFGDYFDGRRRGPRLEIDAGNGSLDARGPNGPGVWVLASDLIQGNCCFGNPSHAISGRCYEPSGVPGPIPTASITRPTPVIHGQAVVSGEVAIDIDE
jgi:hypothetical protein